jgi:hypothetical protein
MGCPYGDFEVTLPYDTVAALVKLAEEHLFQGGNLVNNTELEEALKAFQEAGFFDV